jgi:hypothetical protein
MKTVAKIENAIIGVNELKGENYYNVLLWDGNEYQPVAELVETFERAVVYAIEKQNMIEYIKQ